MIALDTEWGALCRYGLVAAAAALLQASDDAGVRAAAALLLPSDDDIGACIEAAVGAGARDGMSGERERAGRDELSG